MKNHFFKLQGILYLSLAMLLIGSCKSSTSLQDKAQQKEALKNAVDSKSFEFSAQSASPQGYKLINLSHGYSLKISGDSIYAYLPYYGKSHTAPIDPTNIGVNFISTNFEYLKEDKKGRWEIKIKTKDTPNQAQLTFSIGDTGYASLHVIENNRQSISYNGIVEPLKPRQ